MWVCNNNNNNNRYYCYDGYYYTNRTLIEKLTTKWRKKPQSYTALYDFNGPGKHI